VDAQNIQALHPPRDPFQNAHALCEQLWLLGDQLRVCVLHGQTRRADRPCLYMIVCSNRIFILVPLSDRDEWRQAWPEQQVSKCIQERCQGAWGRREGGWQRGAESNVSMVVAFVECSCKGF
jgi:hypothetical protein